MGNFNGALEFLEPAVNLWPQEPVYQAAFGWACFKARPPRPELAREHLAKAVELSPKDALALHRLGLVLRSLGETAEGDRLLARAKQLDPKVA
jgi:tetratricopeptide (TPR) repeat protein